MSVPRASHTATVLASGKVLAAGGDSGSGSSAEIYDPQTAAWAAANPMIAAFAYRTHAATLLPNHRVLVTGEYDVALGPNTSLSLPDAELFDGDTGTWSETSPMNMARENHTATVLVDGNVLVAGGTDSDSAEIYDTRAGTWTNTGTMNAAHAGHTATLLPNGKVLVAGGYASAPNSAELYDPASGTWTSTGPLNAERAWHTATLLPNGKVLVTGGLGVSGYPISAAEIYDPATGNWTRTGAMNWTREQHTATLLGNGKVLVTGGLSVSPPYVLSSSELFDPSTGTWSVTASLNVGRVEHSATLLPSGQVLIAGGQDQYSNPSPSAELYLPDPAPNSPPMARAHNVVKAPDSTGRAPVTPAEMDAGSTDPDGDSIQLSLQPPGPFPIGTNQVMLIATDSHGATGSCDALVIVLGPREELRSIASTAAGWAGTAKGPAHRLLEKAIDPMNIAVAEDLWLDDAHLVHPAGKNVFRSSAVAVEALRRLLSTNLSSISTEDVQQMIQGIASANRLLAFISIEDGIRSGAPGAKVRQAMAELQRGTAAAAAGRFVEAINAYRNAWGLE